MLQIALAGIAVVGHCLRAKGAKNMAEIPMATPLSARPETPGNFFVIMFTAYA